MSGRSGYWTAKAGIFLAAAALWTLSGCSSFWKPPEAAQARAKAAALSAEELRDRLEVAYERFTLSLGTASQQTEQASDTAERRAALSLYSDAVFAYGKLLDREDPKAALFDIISYTIGLASYFTSDSAEKTLGPFREGMLSAARQSEKDALFIARGVLPASDVALVEKDARAWAETRKDWYAGLGTSGFSIGPTASESKPLPSSLQNLTLLPYQVLQGVDNATAAMRELSRVGRRIARVAEYAPRYGRISMELISYDLLETQKIGDLIAAMEGLSKSTEKLVALSDNLPEDVRAELSGLLKEFDSRQKSVAELLAQANGALSATAEALDKAQAVAETFERGIVGLGKASADWNATIEAGTILNNNYMEATAKVIESSHELRQAVAESQRLLDSAAVKNLVTQSRSLADHLFIRAAELLILLFVLIAALLVFQRYLSRPKQA
ncbi:MAG: hypothetical protein AB1921_11355 [Thermodesulfobacteriota bacterium]